MSFVPFKRSIWYGFVFENLHIPNYIGISRTGTNSHLSFFMSAWYLSSIVYFLSLAKKVDQKNTKGYGLRRGGEEVEESFRFKYGIHALCLHNVILVLGRTHICYKNNVFLVWNNGNMYRNKENWSANNVLWSWNSGDMNRNRRMRNGNNKNVKQCMWVILK